jgi:hypothetical protein
VVTSDKDQPLMNLLLSPHTYWLIGFLISDISQASVSESVYRGAGRYENSEVRKMAADGIHLVGCPLLVQYVSVMGFLTTAHPHHNSQVHKHNTITYWQWHGLTCQSHNTGIL